MWTGAEVCSLWFWGEVMGGGRERGGKGMMCVVFELFPVLALVYNRLKYFVF